MSQCEVCSVGRAVVVQCHVQREGGVVRLFTAVQHVTELHQGDVAVQSGGVVWCVEVVCGAEVVESVLEC